MTGFDRIRNLIIDYETEDKYTDEELINEITKVCFARESKSVETELDRVLEIYLHWIKIYIRECNKMNMTDAQITDLIEFYRPPLSTEDVMFMIYCHDSPRDCLADDIR